MELVIPSEIPIQKLKGKELEECVYWLLDAMGARELEWRVGGENGGAPDQGRDLECCFYTAAPDGEMKKERWWVEAKGRSRTVDPNTVHRALDALASQSDLDVFVIATNTGFSNPTRDWVANWQRKHKRPEIRLWDGPYIERLLIRNPSVVVRLFSKALTTAGKLNVIRERFWTYCQFAGRGLLESVWKDHKRAEWDESSAVAVIASEFANGSIEDRPWLSIFGDQSSQMLSVGLSNSLYFIFRAEDVGTNVDPYLEALTYLTIGSLQRNDPSHVEKILKTWRGAQYKKVREFVLEPLLSKVAAQLHDICTSDCRRISSENMDLSKSEVERFRTRFFATKDPVAAPAKKRFLTIEKYSEPCKIGWNLDEEHSCPIACGREEKSNLQFLQEASRILKHRLRL